MKTAALFLLLAMATLASAQVPEELEYQRKLKEYEAKKAVYDQFQAVANVPVVASNDLVSKLPQNRIPPGYAELLLPNYTGKPVQFANLGGPVIVPEPVLETASVARPQITATKPTAPTFNKQQFTGAKGPGPSNVVFRTAVPPIPSQLQVVRSPARPSGLIFFTNANVQLPSLVQRYAPPQQTWTQYVQGRNVRATGPRPLFRLN